MKKQIFTLALLCSFTMATMASAAPTVIRVTPGDSISVLAEGAKPAVKTVTRHVGGLTKADRDWLAGQIWDSQVAQERYLDQLASQAKAAADQKIAAAMPWTMWDPWQWIFAIAALIFLAWLLSWITGRAMRPTDPYPYHQPVNVTNNITCPRHLDSVSPDKSGEVVLRGPATPGLVLYGTIEHAETKHVAQLDITELVQHEIGGEARIAGKVLVETKPSDTTQQS